MYYELKVQGHIRVDPTLFAEDTRVAVKNALVKMFDGFISKDLGVVIGVTGVDSVNEGVIIPGDGAAYYDTTFDVLTFRPELLEVVMGKVTDITDFGAFMNIGPLDGMIHVSQTMDDYVSFSKSNILTGKEKGRSLKVGDACRARIVSVSFKDISNPKIGLTMRQGNMGNVKWFEDEKKEKNKKNG